MQEHPNEQVHRSHDPYEDLQIRYPDWRLEILDREPGEEFFPDAKLIILSTEVFLRNPEHTTAHVVAHLDEHLDELRGGRMTAEQEREANRLARERLSEYPQSA